MRISIITINRNNAIGLKQTIESVIPQLNTDCEYIVIDGNSTDNSLDIIKQYDGQINKWVSGSNKGIYGDMNIGINLAQGQYCLFLNSGDWLNKDILKKAVDMCTGEDIVYFNTILSYNNTRFEELRYSPSLTMLSFYKQTIGHQSTLIKTQLFKTYGLYNESYKIHSDYEFWIEAIVLQGCSCKYVDMFLSYYDMGGRSSKSCEASTKEINYILTKSLPLRVLSDYEYWFNKEKSLELFYWIKSQVVIFTFLKLMFKGAIFLNKIKKDIHSKKHIHVS